MSDGMPRLERESRNPATRHADAGRGCVVVVLCVGPTVKLLRACLWDYTFLRGNPGERASSRDHHRFYSQLVVGSPRPAPISIPCTTSPFRLAPYTHQRTPVPQFCRVINLLVRIRIL